MTAPSAVERQLHSPDPETTRRIGGRLAAAARPGDVICLWGDLGAGKTQLAKGFGAGLGVRDTITSPSFVLMAEYEGRLPLFHIDLYRLDGAAEAYDSGLLDDDRQASGVTLVEWPDRLASALPEPRLDIRIEGAGEQPRTLRLRVSDERLARYLDTAG